MKHPDDKSVRMSDVADLAGVTAMTVSRALRTPEKVSERTRARVHKAIEQIGFVPNYAARSLVSKKSQVVVSLFPSIMNSVFSGTIEALTEGLAIKGYHLLLGETNFDLLREEALLSSFIGWRPSAIVLTGGRHTKNTYRLLRQSGATVIELWNLPKKCFDISVGFSNYHASFEMARSLYEWGYRRIAFMHLHYANNDRTADRLRGYRDAMSAFGMPVSVDHEVATNFGVEGGKSGLRRLLAKLDGVDAVMCASDSLAIGALLEAHRRGYVVPKSLAITGFGDVELAGEFMPALTTVSVPRQEIGARTAEVIVKRLDGAYTGPSVIDCGFSIVRRESA